MIYATHLLLVAAPLVCAGIAQKDFTGVGKIYVLQSDNWQTATPQSKVGCLNDHGKFVSLNSTQQCGTFSKLADYPYTLSTKSGNCTFNDQTQERNMDSVYGQNDYAWNCAPDYEAGIYDELYTIDGFPYVFLCFGDIACYYDAKKTPTGGETLSLWQFRWGSQQMGITPGHTQMQLLWEKVGNSTKREDEKASPGPRVRIQNGVQVPLRGSRANDNMVEEDV